VFIISFGLIVLHFILSSLSLIKVKIFYINLFLSLVILLRKKKKKQDKITQLLNIEKVIELNVFTSRYAKQDFWSNLILFTSYGHKAAL